MGKAGTSDDVFCFRRIGLTLSRMGCALLVAASAGCLGDRAADRTLTIHQMQTTDTASGQFQIDTTQLPADAIDNRDDHGGEGAPVTSLEINQKYRIRVLLVPVPDDE